MASTATWRDEMQSGSFRGVGFKTVSTEGQIGRRNVLHEYPLRDLPYAEDLGRKAREFSLEVFVIGEQYMVDRDQLIAALEQPGAGELVHPYRGRQQVIVTSARVQETTGEGGMAKFSLTFIESGEALNPKSSIDTKAAVNTAADQAALTSKSWFARTFDIQGFQDFVSQSGLSDLNKALMDIKVAGNGFLSNAMLPELSNQIFGISNSLTSLMMFPANLAASVFGQVQSLSGIANTPLSGLTALQSLFNFGNGTKTIKASTPSTTQQAANQSAVIHLVQSAAVIEAARTATQITPASHDEAIALRDAITGPLEDLANGIANTDDAVYMALTDLRIALINDINARAADLARIVVYVVPATMPALVVAYQLYGNSSTIEAAAAAIVSRNHIANPGFVPGGRSLEVLTP